MHFSKFLAFFLTFIIGTCFANPFKESSKSFNKTKLGVKKVNSCEVELDDGSYIDLSTLDTPKKPRKAIDSKDNDIFYFNPCSPFPCGSVKDKAAVCRESTSDPTIVVGEQSSATFTYSSENLIILYTFNRYRANLLCKCGQTEAFEYYSEGPTNTFNLMFQSPCCCPNGCHKKAGGISFGSVILIIFFCGLAAYFIGGFVFLKFITKKEGTEAVPNYTFWKELPVNIKDGFSYSLSKVRTKSSYESI